MRSALLITLLLCVPLFGAGNRSEMPEPKGEPGYVRGAEGWFYACWMYPNSRAVHGRLRNKDNEVFGKRNGETIKTTFGTLLWRGNYSPEKAPEKSTGWLFVESFSGPPFIRNAYDPKTNTIR
jgi:hypothetical protein